MKKSRNNLYTIIVFTILITLTARKSYAVDSPTFPSCENPQGILKVNYTTGIHGVPGDSTTHSGKDAVYTLTSNTLTQCLCTLSEEGIQTNWWKVSSLSIEQLDQLISQGWIYIPNGADWGLTEDPYMAKNTSFNCDTNKSDKDKGDNDEDDDNDNNDGEVLGISTKIGLLGTGGQVLGLATTGSTKLLVMATVTGFLSTLIAVLLTKEAKDTDSQK